MKFPTGVWFSLNEDDDVFELTGAGGPVALPTAMGLFDRSAELPDGTWVEISDQGWTVLGKLDDAGEFWAFIVPPIHERIFS